jgi:hypothetical protein
MKSTLASYILTGTVLAGYWMLYADVYARLARKWLLPGSSVLLLVLIPISWFLFARKKEAEPQRRGIWVQLALIPAWLHSLYISWWILGWMSIGGV